MVTFSGRGLSIGDAVAIGVGAALELGLGDPTVVDGPGTHPTINAATIRDANRRI